MRNFAIPIFIFLDPKIQDYKKYLEALTINLIKYELIFINSDEEISTKESVHPSDGCLSYNEDGYFERVKWREEFEAEIDWDQDYLDAFDGDESNYWNVD